ncbi:hypothetical protein C8J56DRAFT_945431 [Mycena floridula]|nr:hypothetical protein C8J56DRAFT_945431 [Mycena floridula]
MPSSVNSIFAWSTPDRRDGTRKLQMIPCEIYQSIFSYIQISDEFSPSEFRNEWAKLGKVCRFFCSLALGYLYRSLAFYGSDEDSARNEAMTKLCRTVIQDVQPGKSLAKEVRECRLVNWVDDSQMAKNFFNFHIRAMLKFTNMRSLTLENVDITSSVIKDLASLTSHPEHEQLQVNLVRCTGSFKAGSRKLTKFLDVCRRSLGTFRGLREPNYDGTIDLQIVCCVPTVPIRILELPVMFWTDQMTLFLESTPSLIDLSLDFIDIPLNTSEPFIRLTKASLPKLRKLRCPLALLSSFEHCISDLEVLDLSALPAISIGMTLISSMDFNSRLVSKTITRFICSLDLYKELPMGERFPLLKSLCIKHSGMLKPSSISALCEAWTKHPSIEELDICDLFLQADLVVDLVEQFRMIDQLAGAFPAVNRIRLTKFVTWQRDSVHPWEPIVPHTGRADVLSFLKDPFKDYNDCFGTLLRNYR